MSVHAGKVVHRLPSGHLIVFSHDRGYAIVVCDKYFKPNVLDLVEADWSRPEEQFVDFSGRKCQFAVLENCSDLVSALSKARRFERQLAVSA
ncbi:hypothetical protein IHQ68_16610 [Chelatococcus sambhunathii]|uniref:YjbR n=1 Tax=Chelatococcus sambhunathii TaxID=363953 RepID=A0ABU1DJI9_9HYPH|nr:hypothetical protein [Chelatococcus sambhunathii]MDR4308241.1 hypothetical protein [Chelatococcus sambhunathii]